MNVDNAEGNIAKSKGIAYIGSPMAPRNIFQKMDKAHSVLNPSGVGQVTEKFPSRIPQAPRYMLSFGAYLYTYKM